jgi:hypothetical protein
MTYTLGRREYCRSTTEAAAVMVSHVSVVVVNSPSQFRPPVSLVSPTTGPLEAHARFHPKQILQAQPIPLSLVYPQKKTVPSTTFSLLLQAPASGAAVHAILLLASGRKKQREESAVPNMEVCCVLLPPEICNFITTVHDHDPRYPTLAPSTFVYFSSFVDDDTPRLCIF